MNEIIEKIINFIIKQGYVLINEKEVYDLESEDYFYLTDFEGDVYYFKKTK